MTYDAFKQLIESDDFQRLLAQLGDVSANETEGDDRGWIDRNGRHHAVALEDMEAVHPGTPEHEALHDIQSFVRRVSRNVLADMQRNALTDPDTGHALHALNRACGMVACGHSKLKAAHAIRDQISDFMLTTVWLMYAETIDLRTGYTHSNIALLCDLIEAALDDDDDI